jgi:predicted dehydrogenase
MKRIPLSRRRFLRVSGTTVAALNFIPSHVLGANGATPPSEKLNIAAIGIGGMGGGDINELAPGNNMVALCDADWKQGGATFKKFPGAKQFKDFRRMFDAMEKDIDAVIVATPDHFHAVAAMAAIKRGKHVYCEKPLAHSLWEVRELMKAAREHKVVTQLGNQGHSFDSIRNFCEYIWDGAIGQVHTIHAGCRAVNSGLDQLPSLKEKFDIPETLDWDLWQGPAQARNYNPNFLPGRWRGWTPYGSGTVGDWTCHVVDPCFWALDLGAPSSVVAKVKDYNPETQGLAYPKGEIITYEFPAKGKRGPVTMNWYSGTEHIPRPAELAADEKDIETGAVVIGDKGTIVYGSHGASQVRLIPDSKNDAYKRPDKTIPRVKNHHADFVAAIRSGKKAGSDFSYGGPLTELAMLGIVAIRLGGTKLKWDSENLKFPDNSDAHRLVKPTFRTGWSL